MSIRCVRTLISDNKDIVRYYRQTDYVGVGLSVCLLRFCVEHTKTVILLVCLPSLNRVTLCITCATRVVGLDHRDAGEGPGGPLIFFLSGPFT